MALIMAIMALVLLTAIGLTLATSTSTEVQVAANYRWSLQALHNAEAGIEVAKTVLLGDDWTVRLVQRTAAWTPGETHPVTVGPSDPVSARDWENGDPLTCDPMGAGVGYGKVMGDDNYPAVTPTGLLENVSTYPPGGPTLNGAFTLWYRRPLFYEADGKVRDYKKNDVVPGFPGGYPADAVIVVSEGVAPGQAAAGTRAVQVVQATLYGPTQMLPCDAGLTAQAGSGPGGAGMNPCDRIGDTIQITVPGGGVVEGHRNR